MSAHDLEVRLYVARRGGRELEQRAGILGRVVEDCVKDDVERLVLELDESTRRHDEAAIRAARAAAGARGFPRFDVVRSSSEPLLWVADAVAWSWRRDRQWRARVRPLIDEVVEL